MYLRSNVNQQEEKKEKIETKNKNSEIIFEQKCFGAIEIGHEPDELENFDMYVPDWILDRLSYRERMVLQDVFKRLVMTEKWSFWQLRGLFYSSLHGWDGINPYFVIKVFYPPEDMPRRERNRQIEIAMEKLRTVQKWAMFQLRDYSYGFQFGRDDEGIFLVIKVYLMSDETLRKINEELNKSKYGAKQEKEEKSGENTS